MQQYENERAVFLLRYSEIGLLSDKVRQRKEDALISNLTAIFRRYNISFQIVERYFGRILISFSKKHVALAGKALNLIFGIVSYSPTIIIEKKDDTLKSALKQYLTDVSLTNPDLNRSIFTDKSVPLALTVRSSDENVKREDFAASCFNILNKEFSGTNFFQEWKNPIFEMEIEVRDTIYIYHEKINLNWGGLPIEDRSGAILNSIGTFSDIVAALMVMKRGIHVLPFYFSLVEGGKREPETENKIGKASIYGELSKYYPKDVFYVFRLDHNQLLYRMQKKISKFLKNQPGEYADPMLYSCKLCVYIRNKLSSLFCQNYTQYVIKALFDFGEEILDSNLIEVLDKTKRKEVLSALQRERNQNNYQNILKTHLIKYESIIVGDFDYSYCPFSLDMYYPLRNLDNLLMYPLISFDQENYNEKLRYVDPMNKQPRGETTPQKSFCSLRSHAVAFSEKETQPTSQQSTQPINQEKYNEILSDLYSLFDSESWYISLLSEGKFEKISGTKTKLNAQKMK